MLFELHDVISKLDELPDNYLFSIEDDLKAYFDTRRRLAQNKVYEEEMLNYAKAKLRLKAIAREHDITLAELFGVEKVKYTDHGYVRYLINPNNPSEKWNERGRMPLWYLRLQHSKYDMNTIPYEIVKKK